MTSKRTPQAKHVNEDERIALLRQIQLWHFRAVELNLFLDTHPLDERALADYNRTVTQLHHLERAYEERYGPLQNHGGGMAKAPWQWACYDWPWEIGI